MTASKKAKTSSKTSTKRSPKRSTAKRKNAAPSKSAEKVSKTTLSSFKQRWLPLFLKLSLVVLVFAVVIVAYFDAVVRQKFEGKRWSIPSQAYARPLDIYIGQAISPSQLVEELRRLHYQPSVAPERLVDSKLPAGRYAQVGDSVMLGRRAFQFWDAEEPTLSVNITWDDGVIESISRSDSGELLDLLRLDPQPIGGIYPTDGEDRLLVKLDQVPEALVNGLIAIEDREFYNHNGISWRGIVRAAWVNFTSGELQQGGSTLTQQLVKNFYLTSERTISRKLREMVMARLLEFHYDKADILETYLNEVYLGQAGHRAIHGIGLASQFYFGQPVSELSPHQSALLIAMVKGASYYDPRRRPERAKTRRHLVLDEMLKAGVIDSAQHAHAIAKPLHVIDKPSYSEHYYPAYIDLVKRQLRDHYPDSALRSDGLRLFTGLDPVIQTAAERSLKLHLERLEQRYGEAVKGIEGAVVVVSVERGEVLAVVGGRRPRYQGFNRALDAKRPIGSLVKPAVVLAALETGDYQLSSVVSDEAIQLTLDNGNSWSPKNFDESSHGDVTILETLSKSYNQATARLGLDVGVDDVMSVLSRLGLSERPSAIPSRLLGALEASPLEMANVYQTIANHGFANPPKAIREVLTATGEPLTRYGLSIDQAFEEEDIAQLQYALNHVMTDGTGRGYRRYWNDATDEVIDVDLENSMISGVAGKTGTSDEQRDAWFAGITRDYVTVVWLGFDDNRPTPLTGASGAMPVWADIMERLDATPMDFPLPAEVQWVWVDPELQLQSVEQCDGALRVPMRESDVPDEWTTCAEEYQRDLKNPGSRIKRWFQRWF